MSAMDFRRSHAFGAVFAVFALGATLGQASAADPNQVAQRLKEVLGGQGVDVDYGKVSGDATHVVLEATTAKVQGSPDTIPVGTVTLDDVSDQDGGYRIGRLALPNFSLKQDGLSIDAADADLVGLKLPAPGATDPLAALLLYERATLGTVKVSRGDQQLFSLTDTHLDVTPPSGDQALTFTGGAGGFQADLSAVQDPKSRKVIEALGYQKLAGTVQMAGSWQPSDGRLKLSQYDIAVDQAGKLGITLDLSGYTPQFLKQAQAMHQDAAGKPPSDAQGMAMLGLLQQLTLNGATVRFEDASLTGKVLDYVAAQQGSKPKDVANQVKAILPFLLAQLNDVQLMKSVSGAVGTFLDAPKSLEIKAAPAEPVPFALIAAGAIMSPKDLPKTLGVTVTANQ